MTDEKAGKKPEDLLNRYESLVQGNERNKFLLKDLLESICQSMQLTEGIVLGLLFGILGNLVVSHYFGIFEGVVLSKYDLLFWSNIIFFLVGLAAIIVLTIVLYRRYAAFGRLNEDCVELLKTALDYDKELEILRSRLMKEETREESKNKKGKSN